MGRMGQRALDEDLPGEAELLKLMTGNFPYGATIDQLTQIFDHKGTRPVSVPQLLETMIAYGQIHMEANLYKPGPQETCAKCLALTVSTEVAGDVSEWHYKCEDGHELSILLKESLLKDDFDCPVLGCSQYTFAQGRNSAVVGKTVADVAEN